jgi:hypothetical protein
MKVPQGESVTESMTLVTKFSLVTKVLKMTARQVELDNPDGIGS